MCVAAVAGTLAGVADRGHEDTGTSGLTAGLQSTVSTAAARLLVWRTLGPASHFTRKSILC